MHRKLGIVLALGALVAALAAATVSAAEAHQHPARAGPALAAIAIGQVVQADGGSWTIDLRATQRDGRVGGNLRFYCPSVGYYNGAVRHLAVDDDTIKVKGGGGLFKPDGTRVQVVYTADLSLDGEVVNLSVLGRDNYEYTMSGSLDHGLVWSGNPRSEVPSPLGRG